MTYEESIIVLHGLRMDYICSACEEHNNPKLKNFPRDCPLYINCNKAHDALAMAIEALEKQIPKKPKVKEWFAIDDVEKTYNCPCCGMDYNRFYIGKTHCMYCSQAIDWSDEE